MIYSIPIVGWLVGLFFHTCLAIPFWLLWGYVGPRFFYWLPPAYLDVGFWETVALFVVVSILKFVFLPRFGSRFPFSDITKELKR